MVVVLHKGAYLKKQSRTFLTDQREVNRTKTRKKHVFFDFIWFLPCFFNWPHCGKKRHTVSTVQVEKIMKSVLCGWHINL
jgi:hypothetical protein